MRIKKVLVGYFGIALFATFAIEGTSGPSRILAADQNRSEAHASGLAARVTLPDGTNRTVTIDGFGCSAALCSRVFIQAKATGRPTVKLWIDAIASITDIAPDSALFVMKDGTRQRLSFVPDFRVLYLQDRNPGAPKLDLSKIRSLQMLPDVK
jgi:hypothetical protein